MKFIEGEQVGKKCPKCGRELEFEMSFEDCWNDRSGHYTIDRPLIVCPDDEGCKYFEDYNEEEELMK